MKRLNIIICLFLIFLSCEKLKRIDEVTPFIENSVITGEVDVFNLTVTGNISSIGDGIVDYGHLFSQDPNPLLGQSNTNSVKLITAIPDNSPGSFTSSFDPALIMDGTLYYVAAYARDIHGTTHYGEVKTFIRGITFEKQFASHLEGQRVIILPDNKYVVAGRDLVGIQTDGFLIKTDENGDLNSSFIQNFDYSKSDKIEDLIHYNNSLVVVGSNADDDFNIFALNIDQENGDILKVKNVGDVNNSEMGKSIIETNNGDLLIAGYTVKASDTNPLVLRMKSDFSSFPLVELIIPEATGLGQRINNVIQTASSDLILVGTDDNHALIIKTNLSGEIIGEPIIIGTYFSSTINQISKHPHNPNEFILCGIKKETSSSSQDVLVLNIDQNGKVSENYSFTSTADAEARDLQILDDGSVILAGKSNGFPYLCKINASGTRVWEREFSKSPGVLSGIKKTSDGGFICTGNQGGVLYLLKTNAQGIVF